MSWKWFHSALEEEAIAAARVATKEEGLLLEASFVVETPNVISLFAAFRDPSNEIESRFLDLLYCFSDLPISSLNGTSQIVIP